MKRKANRPHVKRHTSLKAWRDAKGFGQRAAAAFLGISQSYYSKLERHEQEPRKAIAKKVVAATGVPLEEVMGIAL